MIPPPTGQDCLLNMAVTECTVIRMKLEHRDRMYKEQQALLCGCAANGSNRAHWMGGVGVQVSSPETGDPGIAVSLGKEVCQRSEGS